jgi:hypothetical protein
MTLLFIIYYLFISLPTPLLTTANFQNHFIFEIFKLKKFWIFSFGKKFPIKKRVKSKIGLFDWYKVSLYVVLKLV